MQLFISNLLSFLTCLCAADHCDLPHEFVLLSFILYHECQETSSPSVLHIPLLKYKPDQSGYQRTQVN